MPNYTELSPSVAAKIEADRSLHVFSQHSFDERDLVRRDPTRDKANAIRTGCIRDIDKIIHCPFYNRYADKTQVFSFYKNDDITRRGLHVQLVSRIGRTIGKALNLNLDLIEAIALGHDIGHTPFGHAGERYLDALSYEHTGRHFSHNIHSVRVLDVLFPLNLSLQTLSGIAAHDGENELAEYRPQPLRDFSAFDAQIEACYADKAKVKALCSSTLEGCVVRVSDMIAYLGKDRQDAERAHLKHHLDYDDDGIGVINAELVGNLIVNIVEMSYGNPYITMDGAHYEALRRAKERNYQTIYGAPSVREGLEATVRPMMTELYERLREDLVSERRTSPIYRHHIDFLAAVPYERRVPYENTPPDQIVIDYLAAMTDDYFVDLHTYLFPDSHYRIDYQSYFADMNVV